ncbi:hypothetical protein EON83_26950 [bacterium]|nr:MAG: hypothetical protein EON83_26950 [bacterium]
MSERFRPSFAVCAFGGAFGLPFLQAIIWCAGCWLNSDLYAQFDDGANDGSGLTLALFVGSIGQAFVGLLMGSLTALAASSSWPWRRVLLLLLGIGGSCLFSFWLWRHWSFEGNHCGPDGCDASSVFAFDFVTIVPLMLPLLWCLGVVLVGATIRRGDKLLAD